MMDYGRLPMEIDVILNPAEIALLPQRDLSDATCVVFDVLRATSSMTTALAHGAAGDSSGADDRGGGGVEGGGCRERCWAGRGRGSRFAGFDIGNSPFEYREGVAGRTIISTTTNGTIALRACGTGGAGPCGARC